MKDFYLIACDSGSQELLFNNISEPTVNKLMYLATFMADNNCLCEADERPLTKSGIMETLAVNRHTFALFWKECIENNLILFDKEKRYYLPRDVFHNNDLSHVESTILKVSKNAIRYVYENTDERSKRCLSHLYKLMPFLNIHYNVLCVNPFETNEDEMQPLSLSHICDLFGANKSKKHRFLNYLSKMSFIDEMGNKRSVISYTWDMLENRDRYWIRINPQFYAGYAKDSDWIEMLNEFELGMSED